MKINVKEYSDSGVIIKDDFNNLVDFICYMIRLLDGDYRKTLSLMTINIHFNL